MLSTRNPKRYVQVIFSTLKSQSSTPSTFEGGNVSTHKGGVMAANQNSLVT